MCNFFKSEGSSLQKSQIEGTCCTAIAHLGLLLCVRFLVWSIAKDTTAQHLTAHSFLLCECGAAECMLCGSIPGMQRYSGSCRQLVITVWSSVFWCVRMRQEPTVMPELRLIASESNGSGEGIAIRMLITKIRHHSFRLFWVVWRLANGDSRNQVRMHDDQTQVSRTHNCLSKQLIAYENGTCTKSPCQYVNQENCSNCAAIC